MTIEIYLQERTEICYFDPNLKKFILKRPIDLFHNIIPLADSSPNTVN